MSQHLFLFTVGPVQSFIAQARKTRDLYAGSALLSELVKAAIGQVGQQRVVFPYVAGLDLEKVASLPNRFIALIDDPKEGFDAYAQQIKSVVEQKWQYEARHLLNILGYNEAAPLGFWEQINQHLNIRWLFQSLENHHYQQGFVSIEQNLGNLKNLHTFAQFEYNNQLGEQGRKCSLDGERNALFLGRDTPWNPDAATLSASIVETNEGLSAVSFMKRFYREGYFQGFPSTARVALLHSLQQIDTEVLEQYKAGFNEWKVLNEKGKIKLKGKDWVKYDDQFLYEDNLLAKYIPCEEQLADVRLRHQKVVGAFAAAGVAFRKYYALIRLDVDHMGAWLSGKHLTESYQKEDLKAFHEPFSKALLDFARYARQEILDQHWHNGQVVYAGGDDFLGFVNLHHLRQVVKGLRLAFDEKVNQVVQKFTNQEINVHFSAGIVIAHYKTPFSEVLKKARYLEEQAKNEKKGNRNAFTIATLKHSGEIQEALYKWDTDALGSAGIVNWENLFVVVDALRSKALSNKFIFNLTRELYQLAGIKSIEILKPGNAALFTEMKRLLERSAHSDTPKETIPKVWEALKALYKAPKRMKLERPVQNFVHTLHIADFISRNT